MIQEHFLLQDKIPGKVQGQVHVSISALSSQEEFSHFIARDPESKMFS